jgi:hypothetical protein
LAGRTVEAEFTFADDNETVARSSLESSAPRPSES